MVIYPNAKINLGLNVVERRQDGYHNIETIFYPIGIFDELRLAPAIDLDGEYRFLSTGRVIDGDVGNNLVVRALNLLKSQFHIPPVDIALHKHIPFGAGLGGGSADAAFMLKGLNELFGLGISVEKLEHLASQLGADCPFFIRNEPVFATGIGDRFEPVELSLRGHYLMLIKPDIHVSTPQAYAGVTPKYPQYSLHQLIKRPIAQWRNAIINDFELSVFRQYPEIEEIKASMYESGALYASMSGSGSSVYGIFSSEPDATRQKAKYPDTFVIALQK